jgi:hypothetical protein
MQAISETIFDILYLSTVIFLGCKMIKESKERKQYWLFGIMAVVLGFGDAFHLIPRAIALCTTGLASYTAALGFGKMITSIIPNSQYCLRSLLSLIILQPRKITVDRYKMSKIVSEIACIIPP